jgi:RNA polymerase sigma-70 factor (ECF subfamily)
MVLAGGASAREAPAAPERKVRAAASTNLAERSREGAAAQLDRASEEATLIEAARRGELRAFERLEAIARPRLVRHLLATGGARDEADEVAQEALARAWESLGTFDGRSRFYTWVYGIAQFVRLDRRRRLATRRRRETTAERLDEMPAGHSDATPERQMLGEERRERLRAGLEALPERQRLALLMRFVDGLSCADIADQLGTTANGVSMLIFRAKSELGRLLPADWFEERRRP